MNFTVKIKCDTIFDLNDHLIQLQMQIRKSAIKQKIDPELDFFVREDEDSLSHENEKGICLVEIRED